LKVGKRFYLEAWADSHGLVADTLAGKVSLSEFVDKTRAGVAQNPAKLVSSSPAST